jgi:nondiscriminating glutamyl-tRNA synthetase
MRTRFAPSPTGFLHIGGLRTALYAALIARQTKGQFLLRIEDTDQARTVPGAVENILETLQWAGIPPDEGVVLREGVASEVGSYGPYTQSQRLPQYREAVDRLLASGHAYRCFCSPQRLEEMRTAQQASKQAPMYDRKCVNIPPEEAKQRADTGEKHVVRLKVPQQRAISFTDDIRGELSFAGHTVDDQVLLKSDGFPTYHLAHVVDDHAMKIDIVIRGEEWLSSLPKHILLWEAFGWPCPRYAHLSLLLNSDRSKLSKRQGDVATTEYITRGYLPEAILNFLALLGWNPGTTQELFSLEELTEAFTLDRVQKAGAVFDLEKLKWLQGQWMRRFTPEEFAARIRPAVVEKFPAAAKDPHFVERAKSVQERVTFAPEAAEMLAFLYEETSATIELLANKKQHVTLELLPTILKALIAVLEDAKEWTDEGLLTVTKALAEKEGWKLGQVLWPMRAAITGREFSPGATQAACMLGKDATLRRLAAALALTDGSR